MMNGGLRRSIIMKKPINRPTLAELMRHYAQRRKPFKEVIRLISYDYSLDIYKNVMVNLERNYNFIVSIEEEKHMRYNRV